MPYSRGVTVRDDERASYTNRAGASTRNSQFVRTADAKGFGTRLREAFGHAKNVEIARKLGVSESGVKNYLEGRIPSADMLVSISNLTNCAVDWLLTGEGPRFLNGIGGLGEGEIPVYFGAKEHEIIQKLAGQSKRTFEDEVRELVLENLKGRGLVKDRVETSNIVFFGDHVPKMVTRMLQGEIAAGEPLLIFANPEPVMVPQDFDRKGKNIFVLRVRGDSMIDEGIREGDYIVCEASQTALRGQTVVAVIDGEKATVKNYYPESGRIRLQPANDLHEPIYVSDDRLEIQGIVIGLWRPPQL
jgi:repressor LexA